MRKRIRKSLKTAWRLTETLFSPTSLVWVSRILVVIVAVAVVWNTYATAFLFFGSFVSLMVTIIVGTLFLVVLVVIFSSEYHKIRELERLERHILQYFPGFPGYTDIQLVEEHKDIWLAYGHVPEAKFKTDVCKIVSGVSGGALSAEACNESTTKVEYKYAIFDKKGHDITILFCENGERQSFPVSVLDIREVTS